MSFTRRHYEEVARIIREQAARSREVPTPQILGTDPLTSYRLGRESGINCMREKLARMFAADNPRFDPARFDMACEPKGEK